MIDKTRMEAEAIEYAGYVTGQFIDEQIANGMGSDFAKWPPEIYFGMVEVSVTAFVERMQELKASVDEPQPSYARANVPAS